MTSLGRSQDRCLHRLSRQFGKPLFTRRFEHAYLDEIRAWYADLGVTAAPRTRSDLHRSNPALVPGIPEFEPIEKTDREDIHYVGPLFWEAFERDGPEPARDWPVNGKTVRVRHARRVRLPAQEL